MLVLKYLVRHEYVILVVWYIESVILVPNILENSYLKVGIGEAWAEQVMAIPTPRSSDTEEESSFELNFGLAPPIGSRVSNATI